MATNYLSLDDASAQLGINRRALSSAVASLGLKTTRIDRRSYLSTSDVERLRAFRTGTDSKDNPIWQGSITYANAPQPQQMPRNYRNFAKEAFAGDPTFYKASQYIITNGAAIPPKLYTDATLQKEIEHHALLDFLEQPNPEQSGVDYREAVIGWLLIAGNCFQYALRAGKSGPPSELWTLPPEMVHPTTQKPRGIVGYKFDAFAETDPLIPPELIRHDKFWNPNDAVFGLSPVEAAAILIDQNTAARKWNLAVLQNGGRMDGAWVSPVPLGKQERDSLESKINGKYRGYANAGKAPVLDAGMVFNPTAYTPTDMDWLESIRRNEGGIANILNIPPPLIGDTSASTYNNMQEAKAASYTEEIFPVLDRIYAGWRRWLLPMFGIKGAYLYYDKESVEVVQQVIQAQKESQFKRAVAAWLQGAITMNEAREICGLEPVEGGDVFRFGAVIVRASELDKYAEQSLTEPAAPPFPQPEPLNVPPTTKPEPTQGNEGNDNNQKPPAQEPQKHLVIPSRFALREKRQQIRTWGKAASSANVTHLLWQCQAGACEFCLENDDEVREDGEEFPNGVTSPEDCHRFCKCEAIQLDIPDGTNPDDYHNDALIYFFGVGFIASRHDQDVAAQQAQEDEEDDDEDYAKANRREEYRTFAERMLV